MEREDIYNLALEKYGPTSQLFMVFEEMSELQKELCKAVRGKANHACTDADTIRQL